MIPPIVPPSVLLTLVPQFLIQKHRSTGQDASVNRDIMATQHLVALAQNVQTEQQRLPLGLQPKPNVVTIQHKHLQIPLELINTVDYAVPHNKKST